MRWLLGSALAFGVLSGAALSSARVPEGASVSRRLALMGTVLDLEVAAGTRDQALLASEAAVRAIEAAERRLSTWRPETELSALGRAEAELPVPISSELAADLRSAFDCAQETGGAFDPTVGPLVHAWALRRGGRRPTVAELLVARQATGYAGLRLGLDGAGRPFATRRHAGLVIEEGGFGKGAGLSAALVALARSAGVSGAQLDFGGQVAVLGGRAVPVALADPDRRERAVLELSIDRGSLATSGNGERGITIDGERIGHLLDPRTGRPAADFGSLTVWTDDPLRADCLSTGLYVLGPEAALDWAASRPGVEVVALVRDRTVAPAESPTVHALASAGWRGRLRPLADDVAIEFAPPTTTGARRDRRAGESSS